MKFNPGRLNRRATFKRLEGTQNEYGGTSSQSTELLTTWVEKRPINPNNQFAIEAGASVLNEDATFIMRKRHGFAPQKNDILFLEGLDGGEFTLKAIAPYLPNKEAVVHETDYIYLVGVKSK